MVIMLHGLKVAPYRTSLTLGPISLLEPAISCRSFSFFIYKAAEKEPHFSKEQPLQSSRHQSRDSGVTASTITTAVNLTGSPSVAKTFRHNQTSASYMAEYR